MRSVAVAREADAKSLARMYQLLALYNSVVVLLLGGFLAITQQKILAAGQARAFLAHLPNLPLAPAAAFGTTVAALFLILGAGALYRSDRFSGVARHFYLAVEFLCCGVLIRSLDFSYDGVILLLVADLVHRFEGRRQRILLVGAMLVLYAVSVYSLAAFQNLVVPFDAYAAYYAPNVRMLFTMLKNGASAGNIVLFMLYVIMLVQKKHEEEERLRALGAELAEANVRLRAYAIEAESVAETRERNRLAREIHDTLGHALTGILAGIDACLVTIDAAPDFARQQLLKIRETAAHGIKDVRRSVKKLRPDDLERLPFRAALAHMVEEYAEATGMEARLTILHYPAGLRAEEEDVLYRVVQEGMTNANRHGGAKHVAITLSAERGNIYLLLSDDGSGCDTVKAGFGLRHMRERLKLLHGSLRYWSDTGFTLEAVIPERSEGRLEETSAWKGGGV